MATNSPDGSAASATGQLGERKLTTLHAIGQSLAIGPIFSAGLVSGLIAGVAGFATPLSVLLGTVGALALAFVVSIYARRFSGAGAMYEYLARGGSPDLGVIGAGFYVIGLLFLGAGGVFIGIGFLADSFFTENLSIDIAWWIWGLIGLAIATGLNHFGVRVAIRGVLVLAAISAIPFLITAVVVIAKGGADGNTLSVFSPSSSSLNDVFNGILFAVTLFIGFEAAASLGEEAEEPAKAIPRAVVGTVVISAVFYLLVTYAAAIGFGKGGIETWFASPSPIATLADQYVGNWMATLVELVLLFDVLSLSIAFTVGASRVFFALGRDRLIPPALASVTRRDTPLGGNLVVIVAGIIALIFGGVTTYGDAIELPNQLEAFSIVTASGSFLIEFVYFMLAVVAIKLILGQSGLVWKLLVIVLAAATPVLAYKGSLDPFPEFPTNRGIIFAGVGAALVLVWWAYMKVRHPDRIATAAQHAETHHEVPPLDETLDYRPGHGEPVIGPTDS